MKNKIVWFLSFIILFFISSYSVSHSINYNQFTEKKINFETWIDDDLIEESDDSDSLIQGFTWDKYLDIFYTENNENSLQKLDIYAPKWIKEKDEKKVMFYVHGGGWRNWDKANVLYKAQVFTSNDYIFVSTNYTLYNEKEDTNKHPSQIEDVAKAFSYIYKNIKKYGGDPNKIFIMWHSAWWHLVSLLATDENYLNKYSIPLTAIKWTISIDAWGLDIAKSLELRNNSPRSERMYIPIFWVNTKEQNLASPLYHVEWWKWISPFLFFTAGNEKRVSHILAVEMKEKLNDIDIYSELHNYPDLDHSSINKTIWQDGDPKIVQIFHFIDTIDTDITKNKGSQVDMNIRYIKIKWYDLLYMNVEKTNILNIKGAKLEIIPFNKEIINTTKKNILIIRNKKTEKILCLFFSKNRVKIMQWTKQESKQINF